MAIQVRNLAFAYDGRHVLEDIDLDVEPGRFTAVLGRNGSGKSTLFRILAGILSPGRGQIRILDHPAEDLSSRQRARLLGFLPQQHRPVFPFTVEDVVLTGRAGRVRFTPGPEDLVIAQRALERIGIRHLGQRIFTELSGGEQQLVMIARVLAQEPRILLFDEPTAHLDFWYQARVLCLIRELAAAGFTVAASLHDPNSAFLYADRFIFLHQGRRMFLGDGEQPWDAAVLERVYGVMVSTVPYGRRRLIVPRV